VIVLHDSHAPAHTRRGMAFVDALYDGTARLEELLAKRARDADDLAPMLRCGRAIPATDLPFDTVIERARPQVLVDARMRKRDVPENQRPSSIRMLASLTSLVSFAISERATTGVRAPTAPGGSAVKPARNR